MPPLSPADDETVGGAPPSLGDVALQGVNERAAAVEQMRSTRRQTHPIRSTRICVPYLGPSAY